MKSSLNRKAEKAAEVLKSGGVVIMSTDTVCGIFTLPGNLEGIKRIYQMKKRPSGKPLPLMLPSVSRAWKYIEKTPLYTFEAEKHWPGPVTLVMETKEGGTIGLRVPDCPPLIEILKKTGPLCSTSANVSGEQPVGSVKKVSASLKKECDLAVSFDSASSGTPSTVIDLTADGHIVLRK